MTGSVREGSVWLLAFSALFSRHIQSGWTLSGRRHAFYIQGRFVSNCVKGGEDERWRGPSQDITWTSGAGLESRVRKVPGTGCKVEQNPEKHTSPITKVCLGLAARQHVCLSVSLPPRLSSTEGLQGRAKILSSFCILCYSNIIFYLPTQCFIDFNSQLVCICTCPDKCFLQAR